MKSALTGLAALADEDDEPPVSALKSLDVLPPPVFEPAYTEPKELAGAATELEELTPLALRKYREVLEADINWDDLKMIRLQVDTAANVINATLKVDDGRLKRRKLDILPKLLEIIAREEKGRIIEHAA